MSDPEKRNLRKPLIVAGGVVAGGAAVSWLAWGLSRHGNYPQTPAQALEPFHDELYKYRRESWALMGRLMVDSKVNCVTHIEVMQLIYGPMTVNERQAMTHEFKVANKVVDALRAGAMGDFALVQVATSRSCANQPQVEGPHYEPTEFALTARQGGLFGLNFDEQAAQAQQALANDNW